MKTLLILTLLNNKFHTIAAAFRSYNVAYDIGADSVGAMGAIAPTGKNPWGRRPHGLFAPTSLVALSTVWLSSLSESLG